MEKYKDLLRQFETILQAYVGEKELDELKERYKNKICSKRIAEAIIDISTLLKVLEKRGVLQYDDISVLKQIATQFVNNEFIEKLIFDYEQWLKENRLTVNNLYNCGKSRTLIDEKNYNVSHRHIPIKSCDIPNGNVIYETEEQSKEILLPNESDIEHNSSKIIIKYKISPSFKTKKSFRKLKKIYFIITIVLLSLLSILIGIILILVILSYTSTAVIPNPETSKLLHSNMPFFTSNVNVGVSMQPSFIVNQSEPSTTSTSAPCINKEKELKNIIINRISKRIGKFWRDICRRLKIQEADIEEIEIKYFNEPGCYEKMFKMALDLYFSEQHLNWKIELMNALEASRRRDLKEMVEEILFEQTS